MDKLSWLMVSRCGQKIRMHALTRTFFTGKDSKDALQSDNSLQQATSELRTLLERFANGMSLSVIGDAMRVLYEDSKQDEELRDWFRRVDSYVRKVCPLPFPLVEFDLRFLYL